MNVAYLSELYVLTVTLKLHQSKIPNIIVFNIKSFSHVHEA